MVKFYGVIISLFVFFEGIQAQSFLKDSVLQAVLISAGYSLQFPLGNLGERFGLNSNLGMGITVKTKRNFLTGAEGNFLFGEKVKENDVLSNISTPGGSLIGLDGGFANYSFSLKGYMLKGYFGKIIALKKPNVNSGLTITFGVGFLQHRIKIDADEDNLPQLDERYKKGYDRLTNGFYLSQFIGYTYLDVRKRINLYAGLEFNEAFTKNRRSWNYNMNAKDDVRRNDILIGIKIGWILPIYFMPTDKYYYY